jgi:rhodanese-related sulfurtransferase
MQNAQVTIIRAVLIAIAAIAVAALHLICLSSLATTSAAGSSLRPGALPTRGIVRINVEEAKALFDGGAAQFIDARIEKNFLAAHVPDAMHLPFSAFSSRRPEQLDALFPELPTVIYCSSQECHSSELVGKQLIGQGFDDIRVLDGGFPAWVDAGFPVDTE